MNIYENTLDKPVQFIEVLDLPFDTYIETIELILEVRFL